MFEMVVSVGCNAEITAWVSTYPSAISHQILWCILGRCEKRTWN